MNEKTITKEAVIKAVKSKGFTPKDNN